MNDENNNSKFSSFKDLFTLGSTDIIAVAITGIFWLSIASFIEVEDYGQLHYFLGIVGISYIVTLLGTQQTITVYSAKKINVVSTLFFISIIVASITALIVFFIYGQLELSLLVIGYFKINMRINHNR